MDLITSYGQTSFSSKNPVRYQQGKEQETKNAEDVLQTLMACLRSVMDSESGIMDVLRYGVISL